MSDADNIWPSLPTETEIYILPNGEIVVADLPAELAASLAELTKMHTANHEIELVESTDPSHVTD
jgi:hypothetical protein